MVYKPPMRSVSARALQEGYRSGLEKRIAEELLEAGMEAKYEPFKLPYLQPAAERNYTLDFFLPNGIIIETKGRFVLADRKKHLWIKEQYPELDLRFVFSNNSPIAKNSRTRYSHWCTNNGFQYAIKSIPQSWLSEPANENSLNIVRKFIK